MADSETENWERQVLQKLALSAVQEQRRARQWGIFFKLLTFIYLFLLVFLAIGWLGTKDSVTTGNHSALVELDGVISSDSGASAERVTTGLKDAFEDKNTKGVILRINSPGGSPVQSSTINTEIHRLREKYPNVPLYAVVEDLCASGGYYVAVAADKIFVDQASILGSIGVLMDSFGLTDAIDKLGIERRLFTAGENKGFLDPFSPIEPEQKRHVQLMLSEIHQQFIAAVRKGRGSRLKDNPEIFSGLVWTGERSIALGLADAIGNVDYVAREIIKAEDIVDFTPKESLAERLAKKLGTGVTGALLGAMRAPSVR
ncbi:MAG TPA: S49 family peptidase [Burkholderiales bacterium]|nr:S49 family peptidase [Burkholderiales bacterium]